MSRDVIPSNIDAVLDDDFVIPVFFVELDFDTDPIYLHTDLGEITTDGHTWLGTGGLGTISPIEETEELKSVGIKLTLSLTDESSGSIFEELTQQDFYQRPVIIKFSARNTVTGALLDTPFELFRGFADVPEGEHGERQSFVSLLVEEEFASGERSNGRLYSDAQLQKDYPGDLGFEFLTSLVNARILFGSDRIADLGVPNQRGSPLGRGNGRRGQQRGRFR